MLHYSALNKTIHIDSEVFGNDKIIRSKIVYIESNYYAVVVILAIIYPNLRGA